MSIPYSRTQQYIGNFLMVGISRPSRYPHHHSHRLSSIHFLLVSPPRDDEKKMTGGGYRPDSVPRRAASIHLGRASPRGSSSLPGDLTHRGGMRGQAPLVSLFGLAPHGVYRALSVSGEAVRSYRTLSPLPSTDSRAVCSLRHFPSRYRGRALPGMPPVAESGPSSRAYAPADARLLQSGQG